MKKVSFNTKNIDINAKSVDGKTLEEYLDGQSLEEALEEQAQGWENGIEECIADSLIFDKGFAPEWYKAQMQNIELLIPDDETREYVLSLVNE